MSLIVMAVHDTEENGRAAFTKKCLESLEDSDAINHRIIIVDNASCYESKAAIRNFKSSHCACEHIQLDSNIGTARAINLGIQQRKPGEHVIKIDNDVTFRRAYWWVEQLEEVVAREPKIGLVGLKRKDLWETPWHEVPSNRCELMMLPHEPGQRWILVEKSKHIMGTCCLHSSALLDKIGYMYQPGVYGYDDTLMSVRAICAGFITCFLSHIEIDHIDPGGTEYITWKQKEAGIYQREVIELMRQYASGEKSVYHDFY
jgi:GT2 family glycosyltransferase